MTGEKGPFLASSIGVERVAETRKTTRTKNALLPGSLDRFVLYARSKTGSFQVSLDRSAREKVLDGGHSSSSLSFLLHPYDPLRRSK